MTDKTHNHTSWIRNRVHEIIFEADTPAGKLFDIALLLAILLSILVVMLESVDPIDQAYGAWFEVVEWTLTILFTIEYSLRIYSVKKPLKYMLSFYGIVDLLSIIPTYLSLFVAGSHYLITIRSLRLLRVFRVLKLGNYIIESSALIQALKASQRKITVFLFAVVTAVLIIGTTMYIVEGERNEQFSSIPESVYWAVVTITTVGYGDISPITPLGKFLSSILMILGYGVLAVPTGIVSVELANVQNKTSTQACPSCSREGHENDAVHCKFCGHKL